MGPRFFKRGEFLALTHLGSFVSGFNGATLLQAWRVAWGARGCIPRIGLQWGHASSSVERTSGVTWLPDTNGLQWGHASSSVESIYPRLYLSLLRLASMGPRFFKRGEVNGDYWHNRAEAASMGPRFFKRGEVWTFESPSSLAAASMGPRFFKRGELIFRQISDWHR